MPEPILLPNGVTVVGKPFPRSCARCRTKTVWPVTIPYRASFRYEGQAHDVDVPQLVVPRCQTCGELHFDNYADEQITQAFRVKLRLLTPEQMRTNRSTLGLSREELAARLGVEVELLRKWEEGLLIQTRMQDNLLRVYFALPQVRSVLSGTDLGLDVGAAVGY
jgi:DNA-binding transcriptional regulator YiaG